ncbi:MAG: glycosyltransferase family 4 protein [Cyanobacteria bacterium K_DeepCast_0m_m1_088]|nr:glycosyltransferase family 4 protein [Cyanobacteria bacterium K_DeepCast_0m_m1_088]
MTAPWLLNLLLYRQETSGFSRYVERVVPLLRGRRLWLDPVAGDDAPGLGDAVPLVDAVSPSRRWLQKLSLAQHGLGLRQRLLQSDCNHLEAVYSPFCDYLFAASHLPQVITCHDLTPLFYPGSLRSHWRYRLWTPVHLRRATQVIAISRFVADQLLNVGVPHHRITVIPNGIAIERPPVSVTATQDWLVVARHDRNKNLIPVIQAFGLFLRQHHHWQGSLVIVGRCGRETENLLRTTQELGLSARVQFVASLHQQALVERLRSAFALISASLMEGFDYPVLEAKAEGVPTLISDIPVHREWHTDSSLLFPCGSDPSGLASVMGVLADDARLWRQLSLSGYALAQQLSLRQQVNAIEQVIGNVAGVGR